MKWLAYLSQHSGLYSLKKFYCGPVFVGQCVFFYESQSSVYSVLHPFSIYTGLAIEGIKTRLCVNSLTSIFNLI